ncbi:hypothetical protein AWENTII_006956 [Aspergillus wentii]
MLLVSPTTTLVQRASRLVPVARLPSFSKDATAATIPQIMSSMADRELANCK